MKAPAPLGRITPYPCFWLVATKLQVEGSKATNQHMWGLSGLPTTGKDQFAKRYAVKQGLYWPAAIFREADLSFPLRFEGCCYLDVACYGGVFAKATGQLRSHNLA